MDKISKNYIQDNKRAFSLVLAAIALSVAYLVLRGSTWHGSVALHTTMEVIATILAMSVGFVSISIFHKTQNNKYLIIGVGFLGTSFLDGYHALVTSIWVKDFLPSDLPALIPWSWVASRLFLSVLMCISWIVWLKERRKVRVQPLDEKWVYIITMLLTLQSALFFIFVPLPRAYYPEYYFHRPEEFIPAIFFLVALFGYLYKREWKVDIFEYWIVMSLLVNFISQTVFMSFSGELFDFEFDMAHLLKKVSYICVLTGLLLEGLLGKKTVKYTRTILPKPVVITEFSTSIAKKISILMSGLVLVSVLSIGFWGYYIFNKALVNASILDLKHSAETLSVKLQDEIKSVERDVLFLSKIQPAQGILRALSNGGIDPVDESTTEVWKIRLKSIFAEVENVNDNYEHIFYKATFKNTKVEVEASRDDYSDSYIHSLNKVQAQFLQKLYTIELGLAHISEVINEAYMSIGVHVQQEGGGGAHGVLSINFNLANVYPVLSTLLDKNYSFYIVSDSGDILHTPDIEEDEIEYFRNYLDVVDSDGAEIVTQSGGKSAYGFHNLYFDPLDDSRYLSIIVSAPYQIISSAANQTRTAVLVVIALILPLALLFGIQIARNLALPLGRLSDAIRKFAEGKEDTTLQVESNDEIGSLVNSFLSMSKIITKRQNELEESEQRQRVLFEAIIDPIIIINDRGIIQSANPATFKLFQFDANEMIGSNLNMLMGSEDKAKHNSYLERYKKTRVRRVIGFVRDVVGIKKDGTELSMSLSVSKLEVKDKLLYVGVLKDLSSRIAYETDLKKARALAEQASEAKSEFVATVSHEIRTPLNGVLGIAQLLQDTNLSEEQLKLVKILDDTGEALRDTINNILDFSKIEAESVLLEPEVFNLKDLCGKVFNGFWNVTTEKDIALTMHYATDCPEVVYGDVVRVRQILNNFLSNSIKFTSSHGMVDVRIAKISEEVIRIEVKDTGVGIAKDKQHKLFQPFSQEDSSTTREYGGSGLGLVICKKIVDTMEGAIGLSSTKDVGSIFWVELPILQDDAAILQGAKLAVKEDLTDDDLAPLQGINLLLAEDSETNILISIAMLERVGVKVSVARDGQTACYMSDLEKYDIILMDFLMPGMDGFEASKIIRKSGPNTATPIIALTANSTKETHAKCKEVGINDLVAKPFKRNHLFERMLFWLHENS